MPVSVGTSGWSYRHWCGPVYPAGLRPTQWLAHLARLFPTVEVSMSHYRLPDPEGVAQWVESVPDGFRWSFKMWRAVTHYRRLEATHDLLEPFFRSIEAVPRANRAAILVQLPPLEADATAAGLLDGFLSDVAACRDAQGWPLAVEARDRSWYREDVRDVLDRHRCALVVHDMRPNQNDEPSRAPLVYVRRHGPAGPYRGSYRDAPLAALAERLHEWSRGGRDVVVYFNNDMRGYAVDDARRLQDVLAAVTTEPGPRPRARARHASATAPTTRPPAAPVQSEGRTSPRAPGT